MLHKLFAFLLLAAPALADVGPYKHTNGLGDSAVYVLFADVSDTAAPMTEGSGLKAGLYTASDSAIATASLAAGTHAGTIRLGDYSSPSASDQVIGVFGGFVWSGSAEVDQVGGIKAVTDNLPDSGALTTINTNASTAATQSTAGASSAAAVQAKLPAGGKVIAAAGSTATDLDDIDTSGGVTGNVLQTPVSQSRTATLVKSRGAGLSHEDPIELVVGSDAVLCAADFARDLPANAYVAGVTSVTIKTESTEDGLTVEATPRGEFGTQAKFALTPVYAGTYVVEVKVVYSGSAGTQVADIDVTVSE